MEKRPVLPGQHGAERKKVTDYGVQLREKQKVKRAYGLLEKQFRGYYAEAARMKGKTGDTMLSLLERRLDNVCYRLGLGASRAQARQIVNHGHILVNGKKVNIPSLLVKAGDVITVRDESKSNAKVKELMEGLLSQTAPKWLEVDKDNAKAKVVALPAREDIDFDFNEQLIVELYSK
jgi:small subunit ribosomal protein S4